MSVLEHPENKQLVFTCFPYFKQLSLSVLLFCWWCRLRSLNSDILFAIIFFFFFTANISPGPVILTIECIITALHQFVLVHFKPLHYFRLQSQIFKSTRITRQWTRGHSELELKFFNYFIIYWSARGCSLFSRMFLQWNIVPHVFYLDRKGLPRVSVLISGKTMRVVPLKIIHLYINHL